MRMSFKGACKVSVRSSATLHTRSRQCLPRHRLETNPITQYVDRLGVSLDGIKIEVQAIQIPKALAAAS